ncbi:imidazole glycerol phosphate synthase subunit HisH [candidate division NPL-UPA2 bacterium]|nr:imidazole glycerol phosphate synthase subunit HisH [candidate division NPL-UPA2 bacterium]
MVTVIDYGMGNVRSVSKALERVGGKIKVTSDKEIIKNARSLVLPGVGAFSQAMENLTSLGLLSLIRQEVEEGKPFLGICLGLQLLFTESEEGKCRGLDIFPGKVKKFSFKEPLKVPHMGWNAVNKGTERSYKVMDGIPDGSYFYFAHSYYVEPRDETVILARTEYGLKFTSAICKDNIIGVQFHPEKSADIGLKLLRNFVELGMR